MEPDEIKRPTINMVQACAMAGVSRRTLYYWMEQGKVEVLRTPTGRPRILADTLLRPDRRHDL